MFSRAICVSDASATASCQLEPSSIALLPPRRTERRKGQGSPLKNIPFYRWLAGLNEETTKLAKLKILPTTINHSRAFKASVVRLVRFRLSCEFCAFDCQHLLCSEFGSVLTRIRKACPLHGTTVRFYIRVREPSTNVKGKEHLRTYRQSVR